MDGWKVGWLVGWMVGWMVGRFDGRTGGMENHFRHEVSSTDYFVRPAFGFIGPSVLPGVRYDNYLNESASPFSEHMFITSLYPIPVNDPR